MSTDPFANRTLKRKNVKGLALNSGPPASAKPSEADAQIPGGRGRDVSAVEPLELGVEFELNLRSEDLEFKKELGAGNGGTVNLVLHTPTNKLMARKIMHVEANKEIRKRIVRELQIMHECKSEYIVDFHGAFLNDSGAVVMCMEYMDRSSLDNISKTFGPVRVDVLGKIAQAILGGLTYLYVSHRIMHRDIKPSNVLVNSKGQIKLCDFGVSSELVNSVADTFVGTGTYMAPERISGSPYTVKSDVWSVGLTLMELAIGKFPFGRDDDNDDEDDEDAGGPQGILDLLQQIVMEEPPKLPKSDAFPKILEDLIAKCLMKDPAERPTPQELYETDLFLKAAKRTPVDLAGWASSMVVRPAEAAQSGGQRDATAAPAATVAAAAAERERLTTTSRSSAREEGRPTSSSSSRRERETSRSSTRDGTASTSTPQSSRSRTRENDMQLPIRSGTPSGGSRMRKP